MSIFSIHQQFPDSVGVVPQHLPEDLVSRAAFAYLDDQHASQWSVHSTFSGFLESHQQLEKKVLGLQLDIAKMVIT